MPEREDVITVPAPRELWDEVFRELSKSPANAKIDEFLHLLDDYMQ